MENILNRIQDFDVMFERLLTEARNIVHADAGSVYIWDDKTQQLSIRYSQNDTKQKNLAPGEKLPYAFYKFKIDERSISGYSLLKRQILNIPDVYDLPEDSVYKFNKTPDIESGYVTRSMLTIPLIATSGKILGVLQIINAQDENGNIISFDNDAELFIKHFAENATNALERAYLTESMFLRFARMAEMRDPKETGSHVFRVSMFAKEIYDMWAFYHNVPKSDRENFRDLLAVASKLHDIGKVGISDLILKKNGRFDVAEKNVMKCHTYICEYFFDRADTELDKMAKDIALYHHEHWDGNGYPGHFDPKLIKSPDVILDLTNVKGLKGEEIPLSARIVAVADVFDALSNKRCYKAAWEEDDVINEIKSQSGKQFDPEVVKAFLGAYPRIKKILQSFPDEED
ncbi:MAG: HD-GYP domain-containing protein [Treponemataceae bacterium]